MSLINQMLQELDARGNQATLGGMLQGQVRAVPQRRFPHPAWWIAVMFMCFLAGGGLWAWLGRTAAAPAPQEAAAGATPSLAGMSLKIASGLEQPYVSAPSKVAANAPAEAVQTAAQAAATPTPVSEKAAAPLPVASLPPIAAPPAPAAASAAAPAPTAAPVQAVPNNNGSMPIVSAKAATPVADAKQKVLPPVTPATEPLPLSAREMQGAKPATLPSASPTGGGSVAEPAVIAKQVKELTPRQLAENEYRKASGLIQQERTAEAISLLERALQLDARHAEARQTLAALLIQSRRQDEAVRALRDGLQADASQSGLAMILARLQLDRGDLKPAIDTLQRSLAYAGERADYLAFLAALLQRDGRHREAIDNYAQALRKSPANALWWMGQGISLQAENRIPEAIEAYKRAKATNGLSAELRAFVDDRLNSL